MRGEDAALHARVRRAIGSPPHAWGRQVRSANSLARQRFTPTCVGKTCQLGNGLFGIAVHPHMRGEDLMSIRIIHGLDGSPPHAWGRLLLNCDSHTTIRFTPTCVGKTNTGLRLTCALPVHPHMRGEDAWAKYSRKSSGGSPPHAWGRLVMIGELFSNLRFTPTCVGKTP